MSTEELKPDPREVQPAAAQRPIEFRTPEGGIHRIYTNFVQLTWTVFDLQIRLAQIIPTSKGPAHPATVVAEENAAVTMAWGEAKLLRDMLVDAVARYEKENGELRPLKLPS